MHFDCRPVDASFFDTAPMRFQHEVDLDATPAKVFAIFDDENSWPKWFHAIHKVEWTSPQAARCRFDPHRHAGNGHVVRALLPLGAGSPVFVLSDRYVDAARPRAGRGLPAGGDGARQDAFHLPCRYRSAPTGRGRRSTVAHVLRLDVQERLRAPPRLCPRTSELLPGVQDYVSAAFRPENVALHGDDGRAARDRRRGPARRSGCRRAVGGRCCSRSGSLSSSSSSCREAPLAELANAPPADVVDASERRWAYVVGGRRRASCSP